MRYFLAIVGLLIVPFVCAQAESVVNAGFVSGVWFSKEPFFVGETVTIYTAFHNNSGSDVSGIVRFHSGDEVIDEVTFVATEEELVSAAVEWQVTSGVHHIRVEALDVVDFQGDAVVLVEGATNTLTVDPDTDTDSDGIGNRDDTDDDADGIADAVELEQGTDPLVANEAVSSNVAVDAGGASGGRSNGGGGSGIGSVVADAVPDVVQNIAAAVDATIEKPIEALADIVEQQRDDIVQIEEDRQDEPLVAGAARQANRVLPFKFPEDTGPTKGDVFAGVWTGMLFVLERWRIVVVALGALIVLGMFRRTKKKDDE